MTSFVAVLRVHALLHRPANLGVEEASVALVRCHPVHDLVQEPVQSQGVTSVP